ncbi:metal homeostatis protein bsd2 [Moniliophthora roreri]|uniref:Metal homeostatis protein bsd2 n=1 Tax=Moniliophthora roreri TaxID=221103 RepID=A0A0W0EZH3_MONRR|nr:metal homeostatis protein bsd2 [Moniliophthora roreri]
MSNRYAPLPNPRSDRDPEHEMEAAFDNSDDEDEDLHNTSETRPLTWSNAPSGPAQTPQTPSRVPGTYDFENVDYDYPPPGSPPPPSSIALPNNHGNSNGLVPSFDIDPSVYAPRKNWFQRTLTAVLPSRYAERLGYTRQRPVGAIGGGGSNDGVFSNVTAKPSRPVTVQEGDETYIVPEDSRADAPPSYSSAQADAVPPYWETTVHAPFSPDSPGEMIIDSLPTGSLFSFLWNMLLSVSFQFVGFLLAHLLHTTHAARLGARAGLGITLIQYGFALREKLGSNANLEGEANWEDSWRNGRPTWPTAAEASEYYNNGTAVPVNGTAPTPTLTDEQASILVADATTEWLSFFLMTVGWFILLTSILGFWRVKRWERNILASQNNNSNNQSSGTAFSQFERTFGLGGISRGDFFRQGFGFGTSRRSLDSDDVEARAGQRNGEVDPREIELMLNISPGDPNRERIIQEALANERRLQEDLRAAGLL